MQKIFREGKLLKSIKPGESDKKSINAHRYFGFGKPSDLSNSNPVFAVILWVANIF